MADISDPTWSETDAANNAAPPSGWPSGTMTPVQVEPAARAQMGGIKRFYDHINSTVTSTGTNNVTLTYTVSPAAYVKGDAYAFIVGTTNTGATQLRVNALAFTDVKIGTSALAGGELVAGQISLVFYDGSVFQLFQSNAVIAGSYGLTPGNPASDATAQVIFEGDSQTANDYAQYITPFPTWNGVTINHQITARSGATIGPRNAAGGYGTTPIGMMQAASTNVLPKRDLFAGMNLAVLWPGGNDLATDRSAEYQYSVLKAYCLQLKRWGFNVIVTTLISRQGNQSVGVGGAALDDLRVTCNDYIRANWPSFADDLVDFIVWPNLDDLGAYADPLYFQPDGTHLTTLGYQEVAQAVEDVMIRFLAEDGHIILPRTTIIGNAANQGFTPTAATLIFGSPAGTVDYKITAQGAVLAIQPNYSLSNVINIDATGNMGFNITPGAKLDVNGNIRDRSNLNANPVKTNGLGQLGA